MFGSYPDAISVIKYRVEKLNKDLDTCEEIRKVEILVRLHECEQIIKGLIAAMEYEVIKFEMEAAPKDESTKLN